ncbi:unnamed protein product [Withania somnifera]
MASRSSSCIALLALATSLAIFQIASAVDPDILTDFMLPPNMPSVGASYFTFSGLRGLIGALNGQSVSYAILLYPAGSINPVHSTLEIRFIDTTNKIFNQTLQTGDVFVFPKGLVHYQYNADANNCARDISAFGSENIGTVSDPITVFNTGIPDNILDMSFKTDIMTIHKIKAGLA